jgi:hypothetical protein
MSLKLEVARVRSRLSAVTLIELVEWVELLGLGTTKHRP